MEKGSNHSYKLETHAHTLVVEEAMIKKTRRKIHTRKVLFVRSIDRSSLLKRTLLTLLIVVVVVVVVVIGTLLRLSHALRMAHRLS